MSWVLLHVRQFHNVVIRARNEVVSQRGNSTLRSMRVIP